MTERKNLLYCHCAYAKVVPAKVKHAVLERIAASEREFEAVPDLCEMSARKDPALANYANDPDLCVVACYPRAVKWLFHAAGHQLDSSAEMLNMRTASADEIGASLGLAEDAGDVTS